MIDIRPLRECDKEKVRFLLPADAAEPDWEHSYVVWLDDRVGGIIGTEVRLNGLLVELVAEPLYMAHAGAASLVAFGWLDGVLRAICVANGLTGYRFSVRQERFQRFVEARLPVRLIGTAGGARQYWRGFA